MYTLELISKNGLTYLTSPQLEQKSIFLAFTTRKKGFSCSPHDSLNLAFHVNDDEQNVLKNRGFVADSLRFDLTKLTCAKQVHENNVTKVDPLSVGQGAIDYQTAIEASDALVSDLPQVPIAMFFADCLPVVLISMKPKRVAIAHAGFKGLLNNVITNTLSYFDNLERDSIIAFLGPSIGKCCYQVDQKRIADFNSRFDSIVKVDDEALDLKKIAKYQLETAGLKASNIIAVDYCTCCNGELFFSYRRDNVTGRQAAIVLIG